MDGATSIMGTRVVRTEDPALLTGRGTYVPNLVLGHALHVTYVHAPIAHARIAHIDTSAAKQAEGVVAVFVADDVDLVPSEPMRVFPGGMARPWVARDVVRYVGEIVAIVVTEHAHHGYDAVERVEVDYEPLDAVVAPADALARRVLLFPDVGSNVCFTVAAEADETLFADCDVTVTQRMVNQRVAPCPLGVRSAAAVWADGRLTQWSTNQGAHDVKATLAAAHGVDSEAVRVITPDVGGAFGALSGVYPCEVLVGWVARRLGRPARWVETRTESMHDLGHGRAQTQTCTLGGTSDGRLRAFELSVLQDAGAYPLVGAVLPTMTRIMASGVYDIARIRFESTSVVTNTCPTVSYRGAGRPEAAAAIERMVDLFAAKIGMDPAELRRRNFFPPEAFPLRTASGGRYDTGEYRAALDRVLAGAGYDDLRVEQRRRRDARDPVALGIGLSTYVEITNPVRGGEYGSMEILPGGKAVVRTGASAHGQGHHTTFAMIASDLTGIPLDRIEVRHGDTDDIPRGAGTGGSKSLQLGGSAVRFATLAAIESAKAHAAELLEARPDDIVLDATRGCFHVVGVPAVASNWADVADAAARTSAGPSDDSSATRIFADYDFKPEGSTFPFGAHLAVVEVDTETGKVTLLRHVACDDAGVIVNPLIVEGQVHGGLAQGIAQALYEEVRYDGDGNPLTGSFIDYAFPAASELPSFERIPQETPTPLNPLGAKGIGESGTIGSTPAVHNAVLDAVAHLGVVHIDMPCTPERVWAAIQQARP
jgi:aerobic carbon-monoxide dehydrogenase large subunit